MRRHEECGAVAEPEQHYEFPLWLGAAALAGAAVAGAAAGDGAGPTAFPLAGNA